MFYLFVKGFINQKKTVAKLNIALFIPFVIVQIVHIVQVVYHFTIDLSFTIPSHFSTGIYVYFEIGSIVFNLLLIAITFRTILSFEKSINLDIASIKPKTLWLKKLIYTGFIICVFWAIGVVLIMIFNVNKSYVFYPLWIAISILIYWMGHLGLQKSKELHEQILLRQKRIQETKNKKQPTIIHSVNSKHTDLIKEFEHLFQEELIHLDSNLSLDTVASQLNVSKSHLSKILKEYQKCSFTEYVTLLRLEEAKKLLKDDEYATYTIVAIGLECGFNSKSAFYNAFKKYLNCTPSDFRKE